MSIGIKKKTLLMGLVLSVILSNIPLVLGDSMWAEQPRYGGTLRVAHDTDPLSLNGRVNFWSTSAPWLRQIYNKLLSYDENYNVVPELCTSWEVSPDAKIYTFHLRKDVLWHDGVKFTSADVKWHYELMAAGKPIVTPTTPFLKDLVSIETPDDYTVIFKFSTFTRPDPFGFVSVASDQFILPKHIYDGTDMEKNPANWAPIGTGPFKLTEYVRDQYMVLEANDKYFLGRPYLDKIIVTYYKSNAAALIALEGGEIDLISGKVGVPPSEMPRLQQVQGITTGGEVALGSRRITFNFRSEAIAKHPWLADVRVRRAFSYAIDREAIVEHVYYGFAKPAYTTILEHMPLWYNPSTSKYTYNPAEAERLLDEAGYKRGANGIRFSFEIVCIEGDINMMEVIKQYLSDVGIEMILKLTEYTAFSQVYEKGAEGLLDYAAGEGNMGVGPDPGTQLHRWMQGSMAGLAGMNMGFYNNSRVNELLDIGKSTMDYEKRKAAYFELQTIVDSEMPYVYLISTQGMMAWKSEFKNIVSGSPGSYQQSYYQTWWTGGTAGPIIKTETITKVETVTKTVEVMPTWGWGLIGLSIIASAAIILYSYKRPLKH
jgi:peptide/nickel transport system substrate-binding protein